MKKMLTATMSLCLWSTACVPGPVAGKVYVIIPANKASSFTATLASLLGKYEIIHNVGKATDDKGYYINVIDATSSSVHLRSENVLISGNEDSGLCGVYSEPHSDPGQYFISVSASTPMTNSSTSQKLLALVVKDLREAGYDIRSNPITCSPQSKAESRG